MCLSVLGPGTEGPPADLAGSPATGTEEPPAPCPECQAPLAADDYFCPACGHKLRATEEEEREAIERRVVQVEKREALRKIQTGKRWILAVSILTLIGGALFYHLSKEKLDKELAAVNRNIASFTPPQRQEFERQIRLKTNMSWDEAVKTDQRRLLLLLVVNLGLAVIYFGLYLWARKNPFLAATLALTLYATMIVANLVVDPASISQGWIVKILVIVGLVKAVMQAYQFRSLEREVASG